MIKRIDYAFRTLRIEVRIGNEAVDRSIGASEIHVNEKCGITTSDAHYAVETFSCIPPLDGRYLSLQSFSNTEMNIAEINVFTSGSGIYVCLLLADIVLLGI